MSERPRLREIVVMVLGRACETKASRDPGVVGVILAGCRMWPKLATESAVNDLKVWETVNPSSRVTTRETVGWELVAYLFWFHITSILLHPRYFVVFVRASSDIETKDNEAEGESESWGNDHRLVGIVRRSAEVP